MTAAAGDDGPIEIHLADGGHVILSIEDPATRYSDSGDRLIWALLRVDGSEHDVQRAIASEAGGLGLRCESSASHHPTVLVIRR